MNCHIYKLFKNFKPVEIGPLWVTVWKSRYGLETLIKENICDLESQNLNSYQNLKIFIVIIVITLLFWLGSHDGLSLVRNKIQWQNV